MLDGFPFDGPVEIPLDRDALDRLFMEYGMATTRGKQARIKGEIAEELISSIYRIGVEEQIDFPTGTPLLAALVQFHRETDDPEVLTHIEREILTARNEWVGIAQFDLQPFPYASPSDLLECADRFMSPPAVPRYFRLRAFRELGAFDDEELLRERERDEGAVAGLTDDELDYIDSI